MRSHSRSHVFLACCGRSIACASMFSSIARAHAIGRRRCCYTAWHGCGGAWRWAFALALALALTLGFALALLVGRSYCRKSPVCLLLSLVAAKPSLARARVSVEFLLCLWWLSRVRVRGHARAPACAIPCSSGVVGLVVYHRLCMQTIVACSCSCRRVGVGVSAGSCRGLVSLFRRGTWGCRGRRRSRSCARFARWGVLLGVVGRGSVLMLCAHAHTRRLQLLAFPVGAASVLSCRVSRACLRCVGYVRAALCGPLVASRPPGDLKNTTNPHQITLGPPPVSYGLHGAGF